MQNTLIVVRAAEWYIVLIKYFSKVTEFTASHTVWLWEYMQFGNAILVELLCASLNTRDIMTFLQRLLVISKYREISLKEIPSDVVVYTNAGVPTFTYYMRMRNSFNRKRRQ